jgi:nitrate reductase cytochrome c-type subunit
MKKILSTLVAALVALSFSAVVFAADAPAPTAVEKKEAKPAKKTKKAKKTKQEKADKRLKKEVEMPGGQ